ncbi:winged helix DNA-binding protein [Aeromicrobium sp. S22]|uniref:MarR family winged helix-turn-helix transcriptional regulator n=1 Tax=Aeromicrobium sp. S22 TaxID=2662029 RepID=UPI0013C0A8B0|nr:MarR family transcriptional regulator [Aeromicrobium sp. S22]MRK03036.1 winged helix DNA-binding protein [Aeromicrobium sp. S22]
MSRSGPDLALLLLGGFRALADAASRELAERGYGDVRAVDDFALHAILSGADSASELGRRMAVTKQAAAKRIAALEARGFVSRAPDPSDGRRTRIQVTPLGATMLAEGQQIMDLLRADWEGRVGEGTLARMEEALRELVGTRPVRLDAPGWGADDPTL